MSKEARIEVSPKEDLLVSILFARADSVYKTIPGCDVWDINRDALTWTGGTTVVAHPPCRAWGKLAWNAKPKEGEREYALWAVDQIRSFGGVLEHPEGSGVWASARLPKIGKRDDFGGWTLPIRQFDFGHKAEKKTWLYICGCDVDDIPKIPTREGKPTHMINRAVKRADGSQIRIGDHDYMPEVSRAEREHTPPMLAQWLVDLARLCSR